MKDGDKITIVLGGGTPLGGPSSLPIRFPAHLVRGEVDNVYFETEIAGRYNTIRKAVPIGCFFFRAFCTLCFLREIDEDVVWIRGHVGEEDETGAALLAAWHMGDERPVGLNA